MSGLKEIKSALTLPQKEWVVLSWDRSGESIFEKVRIDGESLEEVAEISKGMDIQANMVQDMLKQHLKNDKLWKFLANREIEYSSHRSDRIELQKKILTTLKEETRYDLVPEPDITRPFLCSYTAGDLFFKMTINWTFGNLNLDWQNEIIADDKAGNVRYRNLILAEVPGKEHECKEKMINAFNKMIELPEAIQVADTYKDLDEATIRAKQAIEEIIVLEFVPGQCKVCRRLGM